MTARLLAFALWAAVAATVVYWGLKLFVDAPAAPSHAVAVSNAPPRADVSRLIGAAPAAGPAAPAEPANNRFKLIGVVAPRHEGGGNGIALLAVDDKPARPYRVGAGVDEHWVVQTVHRRGVSLGPNGGPAALNLELAPPQVAATGTLASAPDLSGRMPPSPAPAMPSVPQALPPPQPAPQTAPMPPQAVPQPGGAVPVPGAPPVAPTGAPSVPLAPMVSSPQPGQPPAAVGPATTTPEVQQAPPPQAQ